MYFRNSRLKVVKYDFKKNRCIKNQRKELWRTPYSKIAANKKKESAMKSCLNHKRGT